MAYCAPIGLPHSQFLAWARDDRDKAIVWTLRQSQACPQCGTRPDEWDPEQGGHDDAYVTELHQCWGCDTAAQTEKRNADKLKKPGVHVKLVRNPRLV